MSLFLGRLSLSKLSLPIHLTARCFSSSSIYYVVSADPCGSTLRDGDIGNLNIRALGDTYRVTEKKVPMELLEGKVTIGASHGWVATMKNGVVRLQDDLDPCASDTDPKRISLPPLVTLPHCQTNIVTNVAMSTSSPEDEDCIVAIKFMGPQLSLCRPAERNCKWTNIRITDPSFFSSHVMYSKRDDMFSMPASRGHYTGSWDLGRYIHKPKLQMLRLPEDDPHPEMTKSELQRLDSCCRKQQYLVESLRPGETFMVKWYTESSPIRKTCRDWDHFLVLRLDEEGNAVYTKDIGDLSIFLSKAEPFCLPASLYDRSKNSVSSLADHAFGSKNSVYFLADHEFGIVRIHDNSKKGRPFTCPLPYFFPPLSPPIKY
ncbi:PREDICTED: uncharacterized protein LOC104729603 isoform X1 [Camelina sativa]|uniref:Uncharacterized protein LOC104729603 isoform X1 n=1 Tax=Camelina sativa TaxID=90675 RepID=A0ABM0UVA1_CAMSA|nr:PREDICTED: uncharacterized protein LOC104729603 isoform X1 [Camelina sativa]